MKVKIELTVGDCEKCPWMYVDYDTINNYQCLHYNRVFGSKISKCSVIKPIKQVEKFCPLRSMK